MKPPNENDQIRIAPVQLAALQSLARDKGWDRRRLIEECSRRFGSSPDLLSLTECKRLVRYLQSLTVDKVKVALANALDDLMGIATPNGCNDKKCNVCARNAVINAAAKLALENFRNEIR